MKVSAKILAASVLLASIAPALSLESVTVTQLATRTRTASGQPIALPQKDVRVIVSTYDIGPGASLPVHKHPFARYAYVQAGSIEVTQTETRESTVYKAGDFIVEMLDQWHSARNLSDETVKLLVIDQVEGEAQNTILHSHQ